MHVALRVPRVGDRPRAGADQDPGAVVERGRQRRFDIAQRPDLAGEPAGDERGDQLLALRLAPRAGGADDQPVGRQSDLGAPRGFAHDLRDHRRRAAAAARPHRRPRPFAAGENVEFTVGDRHGGFATAGVDTDEDGRSDGRTVGR